MQKKFKAFTLVELIVSMLIFGIIMAAIMNLFSPINDVYTNTSVLANQRAAEQGIASYIIENTRYAQSIGIYQKQDNANEAMEKFLDKNPTDIYGTTLTEADLEVICIENTNEYTLNNGTSVTYKGRIVRKMAGSSTCGESQPFKYDGTGSSYIAMGEAYYGPADYYIRIENFTSSGFSVVVDSDYFYGIANKNKKFERKGTNKSGTYADYTNYTQASVVFANTSVAGANGAVKVVDNSQADSTVGTRTNMTHNTYIVYSLK